MQKIIKSLSYLLAFSLIIGGNIFTVKAQSSSRNALKTVIIDPGHGGIDPGARGLFSTEAQTALSISLKLGQILEKEFPNIKFLYTRTTDALPGGATNTRQGLVNRANMANDAKGDLFISIHLNAAGQKAGGWNAKRIVGYKPKVVYTGSGKRRRKKTIQQPIYETYYVKNERIGTETYIWAADRSDDKSSFIDMEEGGEEEVADSTNMLDLHTPEAKIRAQLYTKYFFRNSALLASMVEDEFNVSGRKSYGVKQRNNKGIWVLQATGMPSILIETGFISNKEEEEYLNSEEGQTEVVNNIVAAFKRYKHELETPRGSNKSTGKH